MSNFKFYALYGVVAYFISVYIKYIYIFIDFTFIPGIISYGAEEQLAKST